MKREYQKWFSECLHRDMEFLIFGDRGTPVIFFPTRTARFYDYENWRIIDSISDKIKAGLLQVYCMDSNDLESFYCNFRHPSQKIIRHMQYEQYILHEVLPFIHKKNPNPFVIVAGCSLGAYHAINIAFRHPQLFGKVVGMSGRFDLTLQTDKFPDLFNSFTDENIYYHMPSKFIPDLNDDKMISQLKKMEIILAVGKEDPFRRNNEFLHQQLLNKGIPNSLYLWEGEAHRSRDWRQMAPCYL
jgi:esterase/lipase superfamily enzyme